MQDQQRNETCVARIGSMTEALHAQRLLLRSAVRTEVIKDATGLRRGCVYALSFPCYQYKNVRLLLEREGIRAKYTGGG